jgi:hypothetical protein
MTRSVCLEREARRGEGGKKGVRRERERERGWGGGEM